VSHFRQDKWADPRFSSRKVGQSVRRVGAVLSPRRLRVGVFTAKRCGPQP